MRISLRPWPGLILALTFAMAIDPGGLVGRAVAGSRPMMVAQNDPDQQDDPASAAALLVRVDRLENRLRSVTGQIEQLQFQNKRLEEALRKMQQDVDFRFQDLNRTTSPAGGKPPLQKRGDLGDETSDQATDVAAAPPRTALPSAEPPGGSVAAVRPQRRGDAFDPAADPNAAGAPRPLGTTPPSAPLRSSMPATGAGSARSDSRAPLDLTHGALGGSAPTPNADGSVAALDPAARIPSGASPSAGGTAAVPGAAPATGAVASLTPGSTRSEYEADYALYKNGQYDAAAMGLQEFIQRYPRDRLLPDAAYFLGESFARLGRHREAAEQFLKLSTDYAKSTRAPDALLRLGVALNALGAKDQACATYQEVDRKYPSAAPDVRAGVERELKRAHC